MLGHATVTANIQAADLKEARVFHADKLGLSREQADGVMLLYRAAGGSAPTPYQARYAGEGHHTIGKATCFEDRESNVLRTDDGLPG